VLLVPGEMLALSVNEATPATPGLETSPKGPIHYSDNQKKKGYIPSIKKPWRYVSAQSQCHVQVAASAVWPKGQIPGTT
jgi:hypothetical protein